MTGGKAILPQVRPRCQGVSKVYAAGMAKQPTSVPIRAEQIEQAIKVVRGRRIMLDADLARLYRVTTAALNQAVKRHADRFPVDFAFQLTRQEFTDLKSQTVTSNCSSFVNICLAEGHPEAEQLAGGPI